MFPLINISKIRRKYLSDPNPDVKIATETVLSDFLREIKHIARIQQRHSESQPADRAQNGTAAVTGHVGRRTSDFHASSSYPGLRRRASKNTINTEVSEMDSVHTGTATNLDAGSEVPHNMKTLISPELAQLDDLQEEEGESGEGQGDTSLMTHQHDAEADEEEKEPEEHAAWIPGQGVYVDHACIIDIMIHHLTYPGMSSRK